MRASTSCGVCRARKKKCIWARAGQRCQLCAEKNFRCDLTSGNQSRPQYQKVPLPYERTSHSAISPRGVESQHRPLPSSKLVARTFEDQKLCNELIDVYFDLIHDKQHILFHRPSFVADQRNGAAPDYLVLAMMSLTARFSSHKLFRDIPTWDRGKQFLDEAIAAYHSRNTLISIASVQGAILIAYAAFVEGEVEHDILISCQAVRMIQALQWPQNYSKDYLQRETEIRLYWECWMMDTWNSVRSQLPRQLIYSSEYLKPIEEVFFESIRDGVPIDGNICLESLRESSMWTMMLPMSEFHAEVVRLTHDLVHKPAFKFEVRTRVYELSRRLDYWLETLPETCHNTSENLKRFTERGYGGTFVTLHITFHHTSQLLYYQFLNAAVATHNKDCLEDRELLLFSTKCKAHSASLSRLMWDLYTVSPLTLNWCPINGHYLVVASTVQMHTLLFETSSILVDEARETLERNFVMLQYLRKFWPTLETALSRLRAFHRACRNSIRDEQFGINEWMNRFLNRYDLPIEDRDLGMQLAVTSPDTDYNALDHTNCLSHEVWDVSNPGLMGEASPHKHE